MRRMRAPSSQSRNTTQSLPFTAVGYVKGGGGGGQRERGHGIVAWHRNMKGGRSSWPTDAVFTHRTDRQTDR